MAAPKVSRGNDGVALGQSEEIVVARDEIVGLGCEKGTQHGNIVRVARQFLTRGLWFRQFCLQGQDVNKIRKVAGVPLQSVIEAR